MTNPNLRNDGYWLDAKTDAHMKDEHLFIWRAMLRSINQDVAGRRVLDVGCNQGAFLQLLVDDYGIAEGSGYDPAATSVQVALDTVGARPITYTTATEVPGDWADFDIAFSHEVLYLQHDLPGHAKAVFEALKPGASYFVVVGTHDQNPMMQGWHDLYSKSMDMPPIYTLSGISETFIAAGFETSIRRIAFDFIPAEEHLEPDLLTWVNYYNDLKLMFRFTRPD